jgi:bacterioferritin-associated ferredoxin
MNCTVCDSKLSFLEGLLAQTGAGTQCPKCWSRLRSLKPPPVAMPLRRKEAAKPSRYRRAA